MFMLFEDPACLLDHAVPPSREIPLLRICEAWLWPMLFTPESSREKSGKCVVRRFVKGWKEPKYASKIFQGSFFCVLSSKDKAHPDRSLTSEEIHHQCSYCTPLHCPPMSFQSLHHMNNMNLNLGPQELLTDHLHFIVTKDNYFISPETSISA